MIEYNRDAWWRTCFAFRGTVLPDLLGRVGLLTGFCLVLVLINDYIFQQFGFELPALDSLGHSVLGMALGVFVVFRTNQTNGRFWEARTHWSNLVNASRNLVRAAAVYTAPAEDFARLVVAYIVTVKETLRGHRDLTPVRPLVSGRVLDALLKANNPPSVLTRFLSDWIAVRLADGRIDTRQCGQMESLVNALVDNQGGCEKIQRTPLPFVYASLIKQVLLLYLATLPLVLVPKMGFAAPLVEAVVSFGLLGIEAAGVSLEDPFHFDANHLPLDQYCEGILRDATDLAAARG